MSSLALAPHKSSAGPNISGLDMRLFGPVEVRIQGTPLPRLRSRKGLYLLSLLALRHEREIERTWIAGTLWPDCDEEHALQSLRQTLRDLRHALGSEAWRLPYESRRTLNLELAGASIDVLSFDTAIGRGDPASLDAAVALYRGPLLEDCTEDWAIQERELREHAHLNALENLAEEAAVRGDFALACVRWKQILAVDPLRESATRSLMRSLAAAGDFAAAVRAYQDLRRTLLDAIRAAPDPETTALYQRLRAEAIEPRAFASAKAPSAARRRAGSLPHRLTALVGRERPVREVCRLIQHSRLVTLTGIGGIGKTRLVIQAAREVEDRYRDGVWFVDLAAAEPDSVWQTLASTLRIRERTGDPLDETVLEFLREKRVLLLLDNCEHLLDVIARLSHRILEHCGLAAILVTSRQPLGITGEASYSVPPLSLPPLSNKEARSLEELCETSEAIDLFVTRASEASTDFALTERDLPALAEICRQVDGVPLAIELAAARTRFLSVTELASRLKDSFSVLDRGSRTAARRQQSMRATLDWSYDLLSDREKRILRGLSVFNGPFTLEAVRAVCAAADISPGTADELFENLVDRSLVSPEERAGSRWFRLLEITRLFARERLEAEEEGEQARKLHGQYYRDLAASASRALDGPEQSAWQARLQADGDNVRGALQWFLREPLSESKRQDALRLAASIFRYWWAWGRLSEGRNWLEAALRNAPARTSARAEALDAIGFVAYDERDHARAQEALEESLAIAEECNDADITAKALSCLGLVACRRQDYANARACHERSLGIRRSLGDPIQIAGSLNNLAAVAQELNELCSARAIREEALSLALQTGSLESAAWIHQGLADTATQQGDYPAARHHSLAALSLFRELEHNRGILFGLRDLALVILTESSEKDELCRAIQMLASVEQLSIAVEDRVPALGRAPHEAAAARARAIVGEDDFAHAWARGREASVDEIVEIALQASEIA